MFLRNTVGLVLTGAAWIASAFPSPAAETTLHSLRGVYRTEKRKIERTFEQAQAESGARYVKDLHAVIRYMEKAGDEFGVRPAKAELLRFEREKTVPKEGGLGTPELLTKARTRYRKVLGPVEKRKDEKLGTLTGKYVDRLVALKEQLDGQSKQRESEAVQDEIDSVSSALKGGGGPGADKGKTPQLVLPRAYARGLALVYAPGRAKAGRVGDLSGNKRHGRLIGGNVRTGDGGCEFTKFGDALETDPFRVGGYWTVVVDTHFPLGAAGKQRVLVSGGFRQDHLVVDQAGTLGTSPGQFAGCGYSVSRLKGWHRIAAAGQWNKTVFYVDGKRVGETRNICREDLKTIGNSAGSGSPWSGAIRSAFVWTRVLTDAEIAAAPKSP